VLLVLFGLVLLLPLVLYATLIAAEFTWSMVAFVVGLTVAIVQDTLRRLRGEGKLMRYNIGSYVAVVAALFLGGLFALSTGHSLDTATLEGLTASFIVFALIILGRGNR
jgi:hypothetical protein